MADVTPRSTSNGKTRTAATWRPRRKSRINRDGSGGEGAGVNGTISLEEGAEEKKLMEGVELKRRRSGRNTTRNSRG